MDPTAKALKEKHSPRLAGRAEAGRRGSDRQLEQTGHVARQWLEDHRHDGGWWSYICMCINQEEQLGSKTDYKTQGSSMGK